MNCIRHRSSEGALFCLKFDRRYRRGDWYMICQHARGIQRFRRLFSYAPPTWIWKEIKAPAIAGAFW